MVYEKVKKVLYIDIIKDIYSMLQSSLLSYIKLRKCFETEGFKFNPYYPCVSNKIIEVEPLPVVFHAYYLKEIHRGRKVVELF